MKKFEGMVAAMVTPFHKDESLNLEEAARLVKHLFTKGLDGVLVGGSTGEYNLMSMDERKALIKCAAEAAKGFDGYLIGGASCYRTRDTVEMARYAGETGADFVLVLPPYYLTTSRQGIIDYFSEIADNTKARVIIYNFPLGTNVYIEPELLVELGKHPNIAGVKNTADMEHTLKLIQLNGHNEKFKICNGYEHLFLATLACGGDACMGIVQNIVPAQLAEMYRLTQANDFKAASLINEKLVPLYNFQKSEDSPFPGPVKYALEIQGFSVGLPRKPVTPISEEFKEKYRAILKGAGVI